MEKFKIQNYYKQRNNEVYIKNINVTINELFGNVVKNRCKATL